MDKFTETIDLEKFLPSNFHHTDLLEALSRESSHKESQLNDLLSLPVNPNYKGDQANFTKSLLYEQYKKPVLLPAKIGDEELGTPLQTEAKEEN